MFRLCSLAFALADGQRLLLFVKPEVALDHIPGRRAAEHFLHFADDLVGVDEVGRLHHLRHFGATGRIYNHKILRTRSSSPSGSK